MSDRDKIGFWASFVIGPITALIVAHLCGVRSVLLLLAAMIPGFIVGVVLAKIGTQHYDERGNLRTIHHKAITEGLGLFAIVLSFLAYSIVLH